MFNKTLIEKQGLFENDIQELTKLHTLKDELFETMEGLDPNKEKDLKQLRMFVKLLQSLEFDMQRVWKFDPNANMHSWWFKAPHCKCPFMDNQDMLGTKYRVHVKDCPLHGHEIEAPT